MFYRFWNDYRDGWRKWRHFSGRTSLISYLRYNVVMLVCMLVALAFDTTLSQYTYGAMSLVVVLIHVIPLTSIGVRRLHDTGVSGWMMLVYFVPFIGVIVLLVLHLRRGQLVSNKYGDSPA